MNLFINPSGEVSKKGYMTFVAGNEGDWVPALGLIRMPHGHFARKRR
jgi:hypothetical protein